VSIDRAQGRHVARLARLALSPEEEERFAAQLGAVLGYIERLSAVDVSGVEPLSFAGEAEGGLPLRDDVPQPCLPREKVLSQAPQHDGQAFVVPRIIE
jgi:aspartyl-tRNA(Asn)/glutamyl-tRNA(Gln) amidotransferase subunit C